MYEKKLKKMNLCPLFVSTFIQPPYMNILNGTPIGANGDLLRIIAYGLNSTLVMIISHRGDGWGFRDENGTWMGSFGDIYDDLANLSMTSAAVTLSRFSTFQISRPYCTVPVVWVTHPGTLQNAALKLLYPLKEDARIALIVSFAFVILCGF
ncbi:unnamed protein product [Arctia plantaginis]|uniref:Uncharacterized protein n=1 Tax=Arctia plantaginis TaxID=874455 RepID=A0A8S0ZYJ8_ARCPL|nr:unnamed protein product [Arctia plantaginis]